MVLHSYVSSFPLIHNFGFEIQDDIKAAASPSWQVGAIDAERSQWHPAKAAAAALQLGQRLQVSGGC